MSKAKSPQRARKKPITKPAATSKPPATPVRRDVAITAAKGRPMLTWVGKRPLRHVTAFPAQHIETFDPSGDAAKRAGDGWKDWPATYPRGGLLFHGDNKEVLAHLLANGFRGKVNLIYIDPPFDSGADYVRRVTLRGPQGTAKLDGEGYTLGEQLQYTDIWANDNYLQFMYERLLLLKELLAEGGSLFLHCDERQGHRLRCLLDEVFGVEAFQNEVVWHYSNKYGANSQTFDVFHNLIYWYTSGRLSRFNSILVPVKEPRKQPVRRWNKELNKNEWLRDEHGNYIYQESTEKDLGDVWEISIINPMATERTDYPTQKPPQLLDWIIKCASEPGSLVLDCFVGSGTTAAVAQKLGRRWIACDINKGAIQTTSKRLQGIIQEQREQAGQARQVALSGTGEGRAKPEPSQLSFAVYRVNDYDLTIHHEEAVALACEHIGVTRTRTDAFFDGTLGKRLAKIVPFGHPLTLIDLDGVKRELEARPDEDRGVILVCLGKEPAADGWIEEWNRLRRGKDAVNRIDVIELRTDERYGKFFQHQPARGRVKLTKKNDTATIEIEEFISPTIVERLQDQAGLLKPIIRDWRSMVDCVLIDPDYDGRVFKIAVSDVPERRNDLVAGRYEIPEKDCGRIVAVKIVDMLGEEVLVTLSTKE